MQFGEVGHKTSWGSSGRPAFVLHLLIYTPRMDGVSNRSGEVLIVEPLGLLGGTH